MLADGLVKEKYRIKRCSPLGNVTVVFAKSAMTVLIHDSTTSALACIEFVLNPINVYFTANPAVLYLRLVAIWLVILTVLLI